MARWLLLLVAAAAGCRFDPAGTCDTRADCPAGLDCLSGVCATCRDDGDCAEWQACGLDGLCATADGRCGADDECASWEACTADHLCATRADHCPVLACTVPYACDPAHHCSLPGGTCLSDADCPAWMAGCDLVTASPTKNQCLFSATAGDDVLAIGTLSEGDCAFGAVSRASTAAASSAAQVEVGLGCGSAPDGRAFLDPVTGELVYRFVEPAYGDTLRRMRLDALAWDAAAGLWRFPPSPAENDDVALAPGACPLTWDRWIMQAGTGALLYACPVTAPVRDFYDGATAISWLRTVREVHAWSAEGRHLVRGSDDVLRVVEGFGTATPGATTVVTLLPAGEHLAYRSTPAGFWIALRDGASGEDQLWEVDQITGIATQAGTYASVAAFGPGGAWTALDADGALYGGGPFGGLLYEIVKRPLSGPAAVVFDESLMPADSNDFAAPTFKPFLRLDRLVLVTRP